MDIVGWKDLFLNIMKSGGHILKILSKYGRRLRKALYLATGYVSTYVRSHKTVVNRALRANLGR